MNMEILIAYHNRMNLYAVVLLITGLLILYFVGKRRFNRRGIGGNEYYSSYHQALITTVFEGILNLLGWLFVTTSVILWFIK